MKRTFFGYWLLILGSIWASLSQTSQAQVINEFVFSHDGGSDINEYIEVKSQAFRDLSDLTLVIIEGDDLLTAPGRINQVFALDSAGGSGYWLSQIGDLGIDNGSQTLLLVQNFTGALNDDLDTDDDGVLDTEPWSQVLDGVAIRDADASDKNYTSVVLRQTFDGSAFTVGGASRIPDGTDSDDDSDWVRNDFQGAGLPDAQFLSVKADSGEALNTPGIENFVQGSESEAILAFALSSLDVTEASDSLKVPIRFFNPMGGTEIRLEVGLSGTPSATPDLDFSILNSQKSFTLPADTSGVLEFLVLILPDTLKEATESIRLTLQSDTGNARMVRSEITLNLLDDDTPLSSQILLNEVLINPPGSDTGNEYIELRGDALSRIPDETYLVSVESDANDPGDIQTIFELSGLTFGSNGILTLLQANSPYTVEDSSFQVQSPSEGWRGLDIFQADSQSDDIENASLTLFIVESGQVPTLGDDVDEDNDGNLDPTGLASIWLIRDQISLLNGDSADIGYANLAFARNNQGIVSNGTRVDLGTADPEYVARIGKSTGATTSDWLAADIEGDVPDVFIRNDRVVPTAFGGLGLNHIGANNPEIPSGSIVSFSQSRQVIQERDTTLQVTIRLDQPNSLATRVEVALVNDETTAELGLDYSGLTFPVELIFPPNSDQSQSFSISIQEDLVQEGSEQIVLLLQNPSNQTLISLDRQEIFIEDNDIPITPIQDIRDSLDFLGRPLFGGIVRVAGVVHGPNFASNAWNFYLLDGSGPRQGMNVFISQEEANTLAVPNDLQEGDSLILEGRIDQVFGLMRLEDISLFQRIAQGVGLLNAAEVNALDEDTESRLLILSDLETLPQTQNQWLGGPNYTGEGFLVDMQKGNTPITLAINGNLPIAQQSFAEVFGDNVQQIRVEGIGSQQDLDSSNGFLGEGYVLLLFNRDLLTSSEMSIQATDIEVYPNPSRAQIKVQWPPELLRDPRIRLWGPDGKFIREYDRLGRGQELRISLDGLGPGMYLLEILDGSNLLVKKVIKY